MVLIININIADDGGRAVRDEERSVLEAYVRKRGRKMTGPRETVLDAFLGIERHVTAEELYEAVRRIDPKIGQATVFRTIKLLVDAGLARETCRDEGPRRYEHSYRHEHHDHLICVDCGAIVEFGDGAIEKAQAAVYRSFGYEATGHSLELFGRCPACQKAASSARPKRPRGAKSDSRTGGAKSGRG
jgi:Fur family ferric uptake transcriptional regulator